MSVTSSSVSPATNHNRTHCPGPHGSPVPPGPLGGPAWPRNPRAAGRACPAPGLCGGGRTAILASPALAGAPRQTYLPDEARVRRCCRMFLACRYAVRIRTGVSDSLFGDISAALREHGSATLDAHCCHFAALTEVLIRGHRDLRSRGITDRPVTTIMVTCCDGRDSADVCYPPYCLRSQLLGVGRAGASQTKVFWPPGGAQIFLGRVGG
jgi:hypothetical protein